MFIRNFSDNGDVCSWNTASPGQMPESERSSLSLRGEVFHIPNQPLASLSGVTASERQKMLVQWNETSMDFPQVCIHRLFEQQVEANPDAIVLAFSHNALTYQQLNTRANQLAHYLCKQGVGPESLIGICLERSLELIVALLAVFKVGAAYVPLDPTYPEERLAFMIEETQIPVVVTHHRLTEKFQKYPTIHCLRLDRVSLTIEECQNVSSRVTLNNLAYVIYTSGSTGKPKGIAMRYSYLSNLITWQLGHLASPGKAKTLQYASLNFDTSLFETFLTLCSGGTLVLVSEHVRQDSVALLNYIDDEAIERLFLPFIALQQLTNVAEEKKRYPQHIREILTAGEQLQVTHQIDNFFRQLRHCTLHNQYGPSECPFVTSFTLPAIANGWPTLPSIGTPIANSQIYILGVNLQPVPIGEQGEIYIGGVTVARGYLRRPEITAERFLPNPFSPVPGDRLYRSGDLARYLSDGSIEFLGRADHQVKVRGFRVELGEIEAILGQYPAIKESAVIVREDIPGDRRLVAYLVQKQGYNLTTTEIRHYLQNHLPEYMIPSLFVFLSTLPLTPTNKVDRKALPIPDMGRPDLESTLIEPQTSIEKVCAGIWANVLHLELLGIHDNFFELGGHSLHTIQVVSQIQDMFQVELAPQTIFEAPTIAEFVKHLEIVGKTHRQDVPKIAQIILQINALTDEEVESALGGECE